ncbi:hypothetical protein LTR95_000748 [Oleoguttula sp. CCFEE 5521]
MTMQSPSSEEHSSAPDDFLTDSDSHSEEWVPRQVRKFGDSPLVYAISDAQRMKELLDSGIIVTASAIHACCLVPSLDTLRLLLSAGGSPDARLSGALAPSAEDAAWRTADTSPNVGVAEELWLPLHRAATGSIRDRAYSDADKLLRGEIMTLLLDAGANAAAVFVQPVWPTLPDCFPAVVVPPAICDDEDTTMGMYDHEWQRRPLYTVGDMTCTLIHTLFETGAYVRPLLERFDLEINTLPVDSLGRTILHAACRSAVGCDASISTMVQDVTVDSLLDPYKLHVPSDEMGTSVFQTLRKLGASMTASDGQGKNVLHHLLEARTAQLMCKRPPWINNSFRYVLDHHRALINKPDNHGNYPLHAALQRLRVYESHIYHLTPLLLETTINELLDAGADPSVADSRGNTALHYLATCGLADRWFSRGIIDLCKRFAPHVDVNTRNKDGNTILNILLNDPRDSDDRLRSLQYRAGPAQQEIDAEVFEVLDMAHADWTHRNRDGDTLLHIVAKHATDKVGFRVRYLLDKGLAGNEVDGRGKTAVEVANDNGNTAVMECLAHREVLG